MAKIANNIGISISQDADAVKAAGNKILDIIEIGYACNLDQETMRTAIEEFSNAVSINNTSITSNHLEMGDFVE